ncbi:MAG TPA: hypothetical protein VE869_01965 [Gemmatimonas sp.]|nr:hypothetical protein [Gemmatimonas sp.]
MLYATIAGGVAIASGAMLPWMTFYAGLQRVNGTSGLYGRLLLAGGLLLVLVGALRVWRDGAALRRTSLAVGVVAAVGAILLLARAYGMAGSPASLMLVPRVGPGLFVIVFGGVLATVAMLRLPQRTV